jgi:hypothetical protein
MKIKSEIGNKPTRREKPPNMGLIVFKTDAITEWRIGIVKAMHIAGNSQHIVLFQWEGADDKIDWTYADHISEWRNAERGESLTFEA